MGKLKLVARKRDDVALNLSQIVFKLVLKLFKLLKRGLAHDHEFQFALGRSFHFNFIGLLRFLYWLERLGLVMPHWYLLCSCYWLKDCFKTSFSSFLSRALLNISLTWKVICVVEALHLWNLNGLQGKGFDKLPSLNWLILTLWLGNSYNLFG